MCCLVPHKATCSPKRNTYAAINSTTPARVSLRPVDTADGWFFEKVIDPPAALKIAAATTRNRTRRKGLVNMGNPYCALIYTQQGMGEDGARNLLTFS